MTFRKDVEELSEAWLELKLQVATEILDHVPHIVAIAAGLVAASWLWGTP